MSIIITGTKMRVAITGADGQLGRSLRQIFAGEGLIPLSRQELDVSKDEATSRLISYRPNLVIHAAAMTDVDGCELHPEQAFEINGQGTRRVALACQNLGVPLVYISTDYVFDGDKSEPYLEDDPPNPINVYGRSKLEGEKAAQELVAKHYIVRSAWLYGRGGDNFVEKVLRWAAEKPELNMVTTEIGSPTYTQDLAEGIHRLITHNHYGIFHLTNAGSCSRYEFAKKILEEARKRDYQVSHATQYERPAKPPPHAVLANRRAAALGITLRPWEEALSAYFRER